MEDLEILKRLSTIVADLLDLDSVELTITSVADDVDGWDSLAHVRIVVAAEEAFGCRFTTNEITGLKTVGDLVALIKRQSGAA
jgi:acyl carrier protein